MRMRLLENRDIQPGLATWPLPGVEAPVAAEVIGRALAADRLTGVVIEHPADSKVLAIGVSGFVRGARIHAASEASLPLVVGLIASEAAGTPVFLAAGEFASAVRDDDLHLVVLFYRQYSFAPEDPQVREVLGAGHAAFRLMHGGYRLRAVWQEGDASDETWMRAGGFLLKRTYPSASGPGRILCGVLREDIGTDWPGHTASFLFNVHTQRLQLTPMQRRVANLALWNLGDEHVASRLAISPATVRQHWRGIFERVQQKCPEVLGAPVVTEALASRGSEKRGRVLEFLRMNLHELRVTS